MPKLKLIKNKKLLSYFFVFFIFLLFININYAYADIWTGGTLKECRASGDCQLNDFMQLAINAAGWLLGITGSLALLALVYGGVMFLISGGSSERVTKAKQIIVGAIVGVAIVFLSYTIIGFVFKALGIDPSGTPWSNSSWFKQS